MNIRLLTVIPIVLVSTFSRRTNAQVCAPQDSLASELRGVAQNFLISPDEAPRRQSLGVPTIDTSTVAHVTDNNICQQALNAWLASQSPAPQTDSSSTIYVVSFGDFYMAQVFALGTTQSRGSFVMFDSQLAVLWKFALI